MDEEWRKRRRREDGMEAEEGLIREEVIVYSRYLRSHTSIRARCSILYLLFYSFSLLAHRPLSLACTFTYIKHSPSLFLSLLYFFSSASYFFSLTFSYSYPSPLSPPLNPSPLPYFSLLFPSTHLSTIKRNFKTHLLFSHGLPVGRRKAPLPS